MSLQTIYSVFTYMPLFRLRSKHLKQSVISSQTPHLKKQISLTQRHMWDICQPSHDKPWENLLGTTNLWGRIQAAR